jgi:hypothetical protein
MYGSAYFGGPINASASGSGMLWEITNTGVYKDLHDFGGTVVNANGKPGPDGAEPDAEVSFDSAGNMYGTTYAGGPNDASIGGGGIVWEITKAGVYKDLHDFGGTVVNANGKSGPDGESPYVGITFDAAGNLYGTTTAAGANSAVYALSGVVWEITKAGAYKDLHDFGGTIANANGKSGQDGAFPHAGVTIDPTGNLYGTTTTGGPVSGTTGEEAGMIWEITNGGGYKDLHDFGGTIVNASGKSGPDGVTPKAGVTFDPKGNMYGTANDGGPNDAAVGGDGMIWEIASNGVYKDLHDFGGTVLNADGTSGPDGENPKTRITFDQEGNFYGITEWGGPNDIATGGDGMIWEITNTAEYKDLHDFGGTVTNANGKSGPDGFRPSGRATLDPDGNLYGAASYGGPNYSSTDDGGMVWKLAPDAVASLDIASASVTGGASTTGAVTLSSAAPAGGAEVALSSTFKSVTVESNVLIPAGAKSATFTVKTVPVGANVNAVITAKLGTSIKTSSLAVEAPVLESLSLSSVDLVGGTATTGTLTLSSIAPSGGSTVALSSTSPSVTVPSSVTVATGAKSATFTVKTAPVAADVASVITAKLGSVTKAANLKVNAPVLASFTLSSASVVGRSDFVITGTLTISSPPASAGASVTLKSSDTGAATVPPSVTVHSGNTSIKFTVGHSAVNETTTVTLTASYGGVSKTTTLTVSP